MKEEYMARIMRLFEDPRLNRADLVALTEARWQWVARAGNLTAYIPWFNSIESRLALPYPIPKPVLLVEQPVVPKSRPKKARSKK